jgi:uridine kinase
VSGVTGPTGRAGTRTAEANGRMDAVAARVILLAGPSGAGKTRLARRSALPVMALDDFYKNGSDPTLPRRDTGLVDWDDPAAWDLEGALQSLRELCTTGTTRAPVYDISANARTGSQELGLGTARYLVAEGIFAAEIVGACRDAGLLESAICVRRSRWVTFVLRLSRDLREHRKPPGVLLRRGWRLARREPAIVAALEARGCQAMTPREAETHIRGLASEGSSAPHSRA